MDDVVFENTLRALRDNVDAMSNESQSHSFQQKQVIVLITIASIAALYYMYGNVMGKSKKQGGITPERRAEIANRSRRLARNAQDEDEDQIDTSGGSRNVRKDNPY